MKIYSGHVVFCGDSEPHASHVVGSYATQRWGRLQRFCVGVGNQIVFAQPGSAQIPGEYTLIDRDDPSDPPRGQAEPGPRSD